MAGVNLALLNGKSQPQVGERWWKGSPALPEPLDITVKALQYLFSVLNE